VIEPNRRAQCKELVCECARTCAWNLCSSMASSVLRMPACGPLSAMTLPPGLGKTVSS